VSVYHLGEAIELSEAQLSWEGETTGLTGELQRLAADFGFVEGEGGLQVVVHNDDEWTDLQAECGFDVPGDGAYYLGVDGAVAHVFGDEAGRFLALKTLRQLVSAAPAAVRPARILDYPATPIRGVVEGFYGPPWTKEDRLAMLPLMADLKMNAFVYAPKDDMWINAAWMQPYPDQELEYIGKLVEAAIEQRIRVCWELHIGWSLTFSKQEDLALMVAKFDSVGQQGVDCFVLAFDDVNKFMSPADEEAYAGYAEAQADFTNRLADELLALYPEAMLSFVPVEYWTDHEDTQTDLAYLGKNLGLEWEIAWTGRKIIPTTITEDDAVEIEGILQRPALLGDNYPVSDAGAGGEVILGPLVGREPGVVALTSGAVFNPMPLPFGSLPALATTADWAWNPDGYDPERSIGNAVQLYAGEKWRASVTGFFLSNRSAILEPSQAPELKAAMDALWDAWGADGNLTATASTLRTDFFELYVDMEPLTDDLTLHPVMQELVPWMDAQVDYSHACLTALDLLLAAAEGTAPTPDQLAALQTYVDQLAVLPHRSTGPIMPDFLTRCLEEMAER